MHWLAIHLPQLPLEVFAPEKGMMLAVSEIQRGRHRIGWCTEAAVAAGIGAGQEVSAGRALSAELQIRERDEERERAVLERLARWAGRFTSLVSLEPRQGLLLELAGSQRLFGGMEPLLEQIRRELDELGYHGVMSLAPTPGGALLLARAGREERVPDRQLLRSILSRLPLSLLMLEDAKLAALRGMGLRSLGDLLRLPRAGLGRRLGGDFLPRLDRLLGAAPDPRVPYQPPEYFYSRLELPAEVSGGEALLFAARRLVLELSGFLISRQAGTQLLCWELLGATGEATRFQLGLLQPVREAEHIMLLLRERVQRLVLQRPVREMVLRVDEVRPLKTVPADLFGDKGQGADTQLLERLQARLGNEAVQGLCMAPEHRPERAWGYCRPGESGPSLNFPRRPPWLLESPLPLAQRGGRPWLDGPLEIEPGRERIESGWWDGDAVVRDYFVACTQDGRRLWIYRERKHWFVHGAFS